MNYAISTTAKIRVLKIVLTDYQKQLKHLHSMRELGKIKQPYYRLKYVESKN